MIEPSIIGVEAEHFTLESSLWKIIAVLLRGRNQ
jgi:hypothetical protein